MAGVGRPANPHNLQLIKGRGEGRDSGGRELKTPPKFKRQAPDKPETLEGAASEIWDVIVEALEDLDLLKEVDGPALEIVCETYSRWREARDMRLEKGMTAMGSTGNEVVAPWVRVEESAGKEFRSWCAEFGLTPSAEMKLAKGGADDGDDENPFAGS